MRVLILEDRPGAATPAAGQLTAAGHQMARCDDPGHADRCRALRQGGTCPLDEGPIDAAVMTLGPGTTSVPPGLVCAARRHIPVVSLTGEEGEDLGDIVAAVAGVAPLAPPGHAEAASEAVRGCLERHELADVPCQVTVTRGEGQLLIRLTTDHGLPRSVANAAAVLALAAVRRVDPLAPVISVAVCP